MRRKKSKGSFKEEKAEEKIEELSEVVEGEKEADLFDFILPY